MVAPSKTPRAAGARVKTDRKDAELIARLLLAGQLTSVRVPDQRIEARRELATVDAAAARKAALAERLSRLAQEPELWPTVARLRAFRGIDTLTALGLHLELGADWERFERPGQLSAWLGLTPSLHQSGESSNAAALRRPGRSTRAGCSSSRPGTTSAPLISA